MCIISVAMKQTQNTLHASEAHNSSVGVGGGGGAGNMSASTTTAAATTDLTTTTTTSSTTSESMATVSIVSNNNNNNTVSAAADSSDNQPPTPQPQTSSQMMSSIGGIGGSGSIASGEQQAQQQNIASASAISHHPFATHHMYSASTTTAAVSGSGGGSSMYSSGIYSAGGHEMQPQQQQNTNNYGSYLNSYEQFYQQQPQPSLTGNNATGEAYGNSSLMYSSGNSTLQNDYKSASVRYHPYLQTPTSALSVNNSSNDNNHDASTTVSSASLPLSNSNAAVSTTTSMSPRIVSSSSPTSTSSNHLQMGNPDSPGCKLQCKKCGIMCTNESELQEHIANIHGASPYGSSGYSSSPYIKEESTTQQQQQQTPNGGNHQQQQQQQQIGGSGGNAGDILDLDSQKMVYPSGMAGMPSMMTHHQQQQHMHEASIHGLSDPLHSMHTMQQRAMPSWDQPNTPVTAMQDGIPAYMQTQPTQDVTGKTAATLHSNQSPYYSPKQSPYHNSNASGVNIKQEYPIIKSEYADSQNYDTTLSGGDMCQQQNQTNQQQQIMPVSSSPAEFPSTTTGSQDPQQQYRVFEPPSSSSVLPVNSITAKAATWKSNEARRPKTYNCTACNKWFTSSGHLKRHYNTTLHKNAVKSSGQPDPATLPISAHHHPARDPSGKHGRRGGGGANSAGAVAAAAAAAAAQQQQQPPAPVQPPEPPEPPRSPPEYGPQGVGMIGGGGQSSHYSTSPSPTQHQQNGGLAFAQSTTSSVVQQNGYQQQQQQYMQQLQSSATNNSPPQNITGVSPIHNQSQQQNVLNGHPNGLAGPSAQTATTQMPSSNTRGLLSITTTTPTMPIITPATTIKTEVMEDTISINNICNNTNSNTSTNSFRTSMDMELLDPVVKVEGGEQQHQQLELMQTITAVESEKTQLIQHQHHHQYQATMEQHQQHQYRQYHNSTPSSTHSIQMQSPQPQLPHIISHHPHQQQQYQDQQQQLLPQQQQQRLQQQQMEDNIFSHTPPPQQLHMLQPPDHITEQQYNTIHLDISTPQQHNNNMQLLQQQQPIITNTATINMDNIHHTMLHNHHHHHQHHMQQQQLQPLPSLLQETVLQPMHNTLLNNTNTQLPLDTINTTTTTTTPPPQQQRITTPLPLLQQLPPITSTIPSFQQLQQVGSVLPQLDHTMTYHTIIGNNNTNNNTNNNILNTNQETTTPSATELYQLTTLDTFGNLQSPQMLSTTDGQLLQFITTPTPVMGAHQSINNNQSSNIMYGARATNGATYTPMSPYLGQRSPQEADLPPVQTITYGNMQTESSKAFTTVLPSMQYSPTITSSTQIDEHFLNKNDLYETSTMLLIGETKNVAPTTNAAATTTSTASVQKRNTSENQRQLSKKRFAITSTTTDINTTKKTLDAQQQSTNERIKCLLCDKEFTRICYLTQHNKSFHSGEYPFRCSTCGKRYQSEDIYAAHIVRHKSLDKPHKCEICPKQFYHKTDLRRHIEAIHTGSKQHTCDVCQKSFCRQDHLRKHLETHTRQRIGLRKPLKSKQISNTNINNKIETNETNIVDTQFINTNTLSIEPTISNIPTTSAQPSLMPNTQSATELTFLTPTTIPTLAQFKQQLQQLQQLHPQPTALTPLSVALMLQHRPHLTINRFFIKPNELPAVVKDGMKVEVKDENNVQKNVVIEQKDEQQKQKYEDLVAAFNDQEKDHTKSRRCEILVMDGEHQHIQLPNIDQSFIMGVKVEDYRMHNSALEYPLKTPAIAIF